MSKPAPDAGVAASADGTLRYATRFSGHFAGDFYRTLPAGIRVSSIGMGTYLGECHDGEDARYVAVLQSGFERGLNLVDAGINYRCQRSERAVGEALRMAIESGMAARDELVVCTKGGYIPLDREPPATREAYLRYIETEYYTPGIMSADDVVAGGHCLAPRFIADQVHRSIRNLGVQRIDLYYLHNPEQQLQVRDRDRFRATIRAAFAELERQVEAGAISAYGCATWSGFRIPETSRAHLELEELAGLAEEVAGEGHHFSAIQLPINLAMNEAVRAPTQKLRGRTLSLLEAAAELGVSVIASASLMQAQLARGLPPELGTAFPSLATDAQRAIAFVRSLPVTAALVGMKTESHLTENLGAATDLVPS